MSSDSSPIKRAPLTYGRRKPPIAAAEADTSSSTLSSSCSGLSLFSSTSANTSVDLPPTSPGGDSHSPPPFRFSWRDNLREIDEAEDLGHLGLIVDPKDSRGSGGGASAAIERKRQRSARSDPEDLLGDDGSSAESLPPQTQSQSLYDFEDFEPPSPVPAKHPLGSSRVHDATDPSHESQAEASFPDSPTPAHPPATSRKPASSHSPAISSDENVATSVKSKGKGRDRESTPVLGGSAYGKARSKKNKIKAPTKKELRETELDRARLKASENLYIERPEATKYTIDSFFAMITRVMPKETTTAPHASSDPIQPFSSPSVNVDAMLGVRSGHEWTRGSPGPESKADDDEDDDTVIPSMGVVLQEAQRQRRADQLAQLKRRVLAEQPKSTGYSSADDDDDLEIVEADPDPKEVVRAERTRRLRTIGGVDGTSSGIRMSYQAGLVEVLRSRAGGGKGKGKEQAPQTVHDLNRETLRRIGEINAREIMKKEEEWVRRGGKLKSGVEGVEMKDALRTIAEKAKQTAETTHARDQDGAEDDEDEDGSDGEWDPTENLRGSASPDRLSVSPPPDFPNENDGDVSETETLDDDDDPQTQQEEDDQENIPPQPRAPIRRARHVIDSDSEDDVYPSRKAPLGRILVPDTSVIISPSRTLAHRESLSSFDSGDDEEKENESKRMWDKSEDKENKAVVCHELLAQMAPRRFGPFFGSASGFGRDLSMSPGPQESSVDEPAPAKSQERAPFKDLTTETRLAEDADPFLSRPFDSAISPFVERLTQSQSHAESGQEGPPLYMPTPTPTLKPFIAARGYGADDDGSDDFGPDENAFDQPKLSLSALFEDGTQKPSALTRPGVLFESEGSSLSKLRRASSPVAEDLPLTLDVGLAPALEVSESKRRQADAIFEKEQDYLVEGWKKNHKRGEPELYVNDHGFLTQTRPDGPNPEVYRIISPSSLTQTHTHPSSYSNMTIGVSQPRHPLSTISFTGENLDDSPRRTPLRRLKKRGVEDFLEGGYRSSPSPGPPTRLNAFDVLARSALHRKDRSKTKLERSEFVEAEAVESDDDEMRGFGGFGKATNDGDEEGDGEDLDKNLEELVDDKELNEEEQAKEKIVEKHQEQLAEDDKELEKLHWDAVAGKFRTKRRNRGVGLDDDSEEEEDDEHDRMIRQRLRKKRKIEGDTLEALGENEETLAFYNAYQQPLVEDDNREFAHLQGVDAEMEDVDDADDNEPREEISVHKIRELVRRAAQDEEEYETLDPEDVSWVDRQASDDEDDWRSIRVKDTSLATRKSAHAPALEFNDIELPIKTIAKGERERLMAWAKGETKSRTTGTARSTAGAAVTGHGKHKLKAGAGSLRPGAAAAASGSGTSRSARAPSMLSRVSDRSGRFA